MVSLVILNISIQLTILGINVFVSATDLGLAGSLSTHYALLLLCRPYYHHHSSGVIFLCNSGLAFDRDAGRSIRHWGWAPVLPHTRIS